MTAADDHRKSVAEKKAKAAASFRRVNGGSYKRPTNVGTDPLLKGGNP